MKIDMHLHLYSSPADGEWSKSGYEIWEYGEHAGVHFSGDTGTLDELRSALGRADVTHGVVLNLFSAELFRRRFEAGLPPEMDAKDRAVALSRFDQSVGERYIAFNEWLMDTIVDVPALTGFVGADPRVLSATANIAHLEKMAERGARGIKLHPVVQRLEVSDPRMMPIYQACVELGLVVVSHTGPAAGGERLGEVSAFAPVLREFPDLTVVLAHLGGGSWQATAAFAEAFPNVMFDLCEITEWAGASRAPSREELARLISVIGPERVVFGSDYPWYDPGHTASLVESLPLLSAAEKNAILGENAARVLGLAG